MEKHKPRCNNHLQLVMRCKKVKNVRCNFRAKKMPQKENWHKRSCNLKKVKILILSNVASETTHTRCMDNSETKITEDQETAYGYGYRDPDPRDIQTALDTITAIVIIWQTLKRPVECGTRKKV